MTGLIFYPFIFSFYLTFHTSFSPVVCLKFTNYSIKALPFVEKPFFPCFLFFVYFQHASFNFKTFICAFFYFKEIILNFYEFFLYFLLTFLSVSGLILYIYYLTIHFRALLSNIFASYFTIICLV